VVIDAWHCGSPIFCLSPVADLERQRNALCSTAWQASPGDQSLCQQQAFDDTMPLGLAAARSANRRGKWLFNIRSTRRASRPVCAIARASPVIGGGGANHGDRTTMDACEPSPYRLFPDRTPPSKSVFNKRVSASPIALPDWSLMASPATEAVTLVRVRVVIAGRRSRLRRRPGPVMYGRKYGLTARAKSPAGIAAK